MKPLIPLQLEGSNGEGDWRRMSLNAGATDYTFVPLPGKAPEW